MKTILTLFFAGAMISAAAQSEGTQYFMNSLPQYSINNPAFIPQYNFSIGLPGLSSTAVGYYNSSFSYNNLVSRSGGEPTADLSKWVGSLHDKNYITTTTSVDVFRIGFRPTSKLYMQLSSTARQYSRLMLPKEVASLFVDGTAPLVGTNTSFSPQAEGLAYLETALSAAYKVDDKFTLGARFKYLNGIASATTVSSDMNINVADTYQISAAADLNLKTAGIQDRNNSYKNASSNSGIGVDLGVTYKLTNRLTLAAALVDFGKISWKNDLYSYTLDKATANYTFSGVDLKELVAGNGDYLRAQSDSISARFKPAENKTSGFKTALPSKVNVSATYQIRKNLSVGGLFYSEFFQGRTNPGGTLALNKHFGRWLSTTVSYSVSNRSFNNLGAGFSLNIRPIQFYVVGDNLLGVPVSLVAHQNLNSYINSTRSFNMRFGINIIWGRDKSLDQPGKNSRNVGGNSAGSRNEKVTSGDAKSLSTQKSVQKTKVRSGKASYLKVRRKRR